jgi:hypothetical protein
MREILWMPEKGMFAEYKDLLGNQLLHTQPGLWTFYHIIDSELPTPEEALSMADWVGTHIPHIPVYGPGIPENETNYVLATSNWMPYTWSINNVTMNENIHTALAFWKAGRSDEACRITRSSILASMFMGICPGNIGSMNYLDVYRRESQRDFADGAGVLSRALVEGLFGIQPDLLGGKLSFRPGFPEEWNNAGIEHPDFSVSFERKSSRDHYIICSGFPKPVSLHALIPAVSDSASVYVNGNKISALIDIHSAIPSLSFEVPDAGTWDISIEWHGKQMEIEDRVFSWPATAPEFIPGISGIDWETPISADHKIETIDLSGIYNDKVTDIFEFGKYRSPRSPGVSLSLPAQGIGSWAGHYNEIAVINDSGLRSLGGLLELPNGVCFSTPAEENAPNAAFVSQWDNYPNKISVPLKGKAHRLFLLMAGSTYHMQSHKENARVIVQYADGSTSVLPLVNPGNWWPIDQDYFIDDYQFYRPGPLPPRVDLKTGELRFLKQETFKGSGGMIDGGSATILALALDPSKKIKSFSIEANANEVVIGLLSATLER